MKRNIRGYGSTEAFLIIKWEGFPALIDLISLITSTAFNQLSINLKSVIINFRISADSQPYTLATKLTTSIYPVGLYYSKIQRYVSTCVCSYLCIGLYASS